MENNKYLSRDKTQALIDELKVKQADGKAFLDGLAKKGYTIEGFNDRPVEQPKPTGLLDKLSQRKQNIDQTVVDPNINPLRATVRGFGQITGGAGDIVGAGIGAVASTANDLTGGALGEAASSIGQSIFETPAGKQGIELAKQGMESYGAWKQSNPEYAKDLEAVVNIATLFPIGKGTQLAGKGAVGATDIALQGAKSGLAGAKTLPGKVSNVSKSIQNIGKTPKTLEGVVGEIAQGTTETINPVKTALSIVDTSKVNTYSDLLGQIKKTIPEVSQKVDSEFLKDSTIYSLDNLAVKQTTKAGTELTTDYVTKGLNELKDFYTSVGDDLSKADIEDLIKKSTTQGLTKKEVNDIARLHGRELNAYNANGQLASGLSKQAAENTRQGLKNTARQGLSEEAKNLDSQISALYDTQTLIEKNVEKVNKLKQLIQDRGLVEKIGYNFSKYADILTGGSLRGLVGGILPRGVGNKVMNALDLEDNLRANLDVVEKALKSKTEKELISNLNQLKSSVDDSARSTSSLNKNTTATTKKNIKANNISETIPQKVKGATKNVEKSIPKELQPLAEPITSVNPTGGVLVDYTPQARMTAPLGENMTTLANSMKKKPDTMVTIYRGAPKTQKGINPGDFISTDRNSALSYAEDGNVISKKVRLGDILDDMDEPLGGDYLYRPGAFEEIGTKVRDITKSDWYKNYTKYLGDNKSKFPTIQSWLDGMKASGKPKQQLTEIWNKANGKN
jgi:hypothetical protein